jgi:DNA-binding beta-propeller fold protein YncE
MRHQITEGLSYPEDVAASPDGSLLAVSHSMSDKHGVSLHSIDATSLAPRPAQAMLRVGTGFHGLSFSPDSRHLALSEVGTPGYVEVVRTDSGTCTCRLENLYAPLKPKGVAISADGCFVVLALAPNVLREGEAAASGGMLAVHRFDAERGIIAPKAVAEIFSSSAALYAVESCTILPASASRPFRILAVDQAADLVRAFDFDASQGTLASAGVFAAGMSFPHGIDASPDGRFVAITNYGDDTLRIMRLAT